MNFKLLKQCNLSELNDVQIDQYRNSITSAFPKIIFKSQAIQNYWEKLEKYFPDFQLLLLDENEDLMNQYLTNGGKSIPKLIVYNDKGEELFNWGPRPAELQEIYLQLKKEEKSFDDINLVLQKFYNDDKGKSVQKEICALLRKTQSN